MRLALNLAARAGVFSNAPVTAQKSKRNRSENGQSQRGIVERQAFRHLCSHLSLLSPEVAKQGSRKISGSVLPATKLALRFLT
jgi:hypothetical protein